MTVRRETRARELLDGRVPPGDRAASLADIAWLNAWFGGHALTLRGVRAVVGAERSPARPDPATRGASRARGPRSNARARPLWVLDVGGGGGDLAARLVRWARAEGRAIRVLVADAEPDSLRLARLARAACPEIHVVRADAAALPVREGAMDVAVTVLTLHHLDPDAAVATLREMGAAARLGVVVNDLLRNRLSLALVWLATRLFCCHPISRHDGPLSVRRAYAPGELSALAEKAGLHGFRVRRHPVLGRLLAVVSP